MKNFTCSAVFFLLMLVCSVPAVAQSIDANNTLDAEEIRRPNIVKLNSLGLLFKNLSLIYERGIMPRVSVGLGIGYKYQGTVPSILEVNSSIIEVDFEDIKGISITPEARYYLRNCDGGKLEGFYTGLYMRYTGYDTSSDFEYRPENDPAESYNTDLTMREFGMGIQLGYQMIIKERFSIDFLILGPRFSRYKLSYEFDQPISNSFKSDLSEYLTETINRLGLDYEVNIKNEGQTTASSSFSFLNARVGLSFGYTF